MFLLKLSVLTNFISSEIPHVVRGLYAEVNRSIGRAAPAPAYEKYEWDFKGRTFVFATKRGCSGRAVTPSEASDLLVAMIEK
jgi:hypothetical protein